MSISLRDRMAPTAPRIMVQVLGVRPGERLVVVTDFERPRSITDLLVAAITLLWPVIRQLREERRARALQTA
ncbi:MAG TPA: hypothetical protein VGR25_10935 [bacterium]|nr:hypothetical protein [bacterium]